MSNGPSTTSPSTMPRSITWVRWWRGAPGSIPGPGVARLPAAQASPSWSPWRPSTDAGAFMTDLILHHYPNSPFSEKVRIAFGIKQLAWKSVVIPNIMPKPDLMPLTGGYRKTPVMQVGADIYCDTQLIMLEVEKRAPRPSLRSADKA